MAAPVRLTALIYEYVEGMAERRTPHREGHLKLIEDFAADGRLVIAGALGDPPTGGLLVFRDEAAAEAFIDADPYVEAELVTARRIEPYSVVAHRPLDG
jgi:uncharacterized protein YciI